MSLFDDRDNKRTFGSKIEIAYIIVSLYKIINISCFSLVNNHRFLKTIIKIDY